MRTAAVLALALIISACGSFAPVALKGGETCATCGQRIMDVKLAAEAISPQGNVLFFRTPECLARHIREHPQAVAAKWVTDYPTGRMVRPESATYVRAIIDENSREFGYVAFAKVSDAAEFGKDHMSSPVDWLMIQRMSADRKSN